MHMLVWTLLALLVAACANMGRPEGGPRDTEAPRFVRSNPMPGARNASPQKLVAYFDENIQLQDAFNKVVVSPPQKTAPSVSANGRRLTVEFKDTLPANTAITVDFADAIKDLNEGNVLDGFALDFSTGKDLDTLRISGMVLGAENLEPAQGMLVGVYRDLSDSAITKLPLERIARTNQLGQFTVRNLSPGKYRVFALNDLNRDWHWDRSEDLAFYDSILVPEVKEISVTDTLFASRGTDSLVSRRGVQYLPNDVLLTWSNINYKAHYLQDYKRPERRMISLNFGAPQDSMPTLTVVDGAPLKGVKNSEWALRSRNAAGDSLKYWLSDPRIIAADSLRLAVRYQKSDSLDRLYWTSDTLRFFFKDPVKKDKKEQAADSIPQVELLNIRALTAGAQELNRPVVLESTYPIATLDTAAVQLEMQVDTVWTPVKPVFTADAEDPLRRLNLSLAWTEGAKYRLKMDSLAVHSIYGTANKAFNHEFSVKKAEDYSSISFRLPGLDTCRVVVQLLNSSDAPLYTAVKEPGKSSVKIPFVAPGTYYARLFIDSNGDGLWTPGDYRLLRQPEEVYYFSKKLNLKKNWDIEQTWNYDELPLDMQKPYAIKKNKPKLKDGEKPPVEEEENEDGVYNPNANPFDKTGRGTKSKNSTGGMGRGGMRRNTL